MSTLIRKSYMIGCEKSVTTAAKGSEILVSVTRTIPVIVQTSDFDDFTPEEDRFNRT